MSAQKYLMITVMALSCAPALADVTEVWLDKGQVELQLGSGEIVTLNAGEYLKCDDEDGDGDADDCEVVPIALAPARPEFVQLAGTLAPGGLAPGATAVFGSAIPAGAVAIGAAAIVGGIVAGVVASDGNGSSTTSTVSTSP